MSSRKQMAAKNVLSAVLYYVANSLIGFVNRKVFTVYLGSEVLGLNGLVVSVISMLSLMELGIASSIGYSLYKPLQEGNDSEVKAIMQLFSRMYRYIGIGVGVIGAILVPFLPYIIKSELDQEYIVKVYIIFLADAVLSYFMAYRRTLLVSAQKDYINKNADTILYIVTGVLQIGIICIWQNYLASLLIKLAFTVINNLYLYLKVGKMFPYLSDRNVQGKVSEDVKKKLVENVKALFVIKVASYCVFGTDNILLSMFADLSAVAIYSGYTLILGIVNNIFNRSFGYITANIGNYLVSKNNDEIYDLYKKLFFMNYLITSYTSIAMLTVFNEFIGGIWLEEAYTFPITVVAILVFNNYSRYITQCTEAFRSAAGLYSPRPYVKYFALLEGIINLVVSVGLAKGCGLGIYGIFLGTSVSTLVSTIGVPWIIYRFLLKRPLREYFSVYMKYLGLTIMGAIISLMIFSILQTKFAIVNFVMGGIVSLLVLMGINYLVFRKSSEWQYCLGLGTEVVHKVTKKLKK